MEISVSFTHDCLLQMYWLSRELKVPLSLVEVTPVDTKVGVCVLNLPMIFRVSK